MMAPQETSSNGVLFETDAETPDLALKKVPVREAKENWNPKYLWDVIIFFLAINSAGLYGGYLVFVSAKWQTDVFLIILYVASVLGITAGTHRLWSHKSYKAKWPLQLILMIFHTLAFQFPVIQWVRDHRMHHKYTDTDADPHNSTRGFFFSHLGNLLVDRHPDFERKAKGLDVSDVEDNPILRFQIKYYAILVPVISIILPMALPVYIWDETWTNAFLVTVCLRLALSHNASSSVNSVAHIWGYKPYDKNVPGTDSTLSFVVLGEGYHNYHHTFPWDYRTGEFGLINLSASFIDFFARIGWAYDLKAVSEEIIQKRAVRTGDGSHHLWGWGDKEQSDEEMKAAIRIYPKDK